MTKTVFFASLLALGLALPACGSDDDTTKASDTGTTGSGGGGTGATGSASGTGTGGGATGLPDVKSYVVLGDSISDGGGTGPFFYDLLADDLKAKYGQGLQVVSTAQSGAESNGLPGQVTALPASLPGPVVVTITIGGNDMQANIIQILQGNDQSARDQFRTHIGDAMTELTTPGRFGDGVEVFVFEADIYDPTDDGGDFSNCPAPLNLVPMQPTDGFFADWNGVVNEEVPAHPSGSVAPLHDTFHGHGVSSADTWFVGDCIHPNTAGHDQIRGMFYERITGEAAP